MTLSEENYLKAIFHLSRDHTKGVPTNAIAAKMETKASSVTDMLKKLAEKDLVIYRRYQGAKLTEEGKFFAAGIVRKHRLWEVFLVEHLNFTWHEVHDVAEQMEHIKSEKLVDELDDFLGNPTVDPHGDPIPDKQGNMQGVEKILLSSCKEGDTGVCVGVKSNATRFLQYLDKLKISLGNNLIVMSKEPFDQSMKIKNNGEILNISAITANNIYIRKK